jgi:hypothetical protein
MSETNIKHEVRGDGKRSYQHTALLGADFHTFNYHDDAWHVLSEIADKIPSDDRDWALLTDSKREEANLDYALHLGMLEAVADTAVYLQPIKGSKDEYEFVLQSGGADNLNVERHVPMWLVDISAPSDLCKPTEIKVVEDTDEYILLKITKSEEYP